MPNDPITPKRHNSLNTHENLDGFGHVDDLIEHVRPPNYCPREYRTYAHEKARAMRARAAGEITRALRHEANCERIYATIPQAWKW